MYNYNRAMTATRKQAASLLYFPLCLSLPLSFLLPLSCLWLSASLFSLLCLSAYLLSFPPLSFLVSLVAASLLYFPLCLPALSFLLPLFFLWLSASFRCLPCLFPISFLSSVSPFLRLSCFLPFLFLLFPFTSWKKKEGEGIKMSRLKN